MGAQLNISLQLIAENIYNLLIQMLFGASKLGILYRQVKVTALESRWTGRPACSHSMTVGGGRVVTAGLSLSAAGSLHLYRI